MKAGAFHRFSQLISGILPTVRLIPAMNMSQGTSIRLLVIGDWY